MEYTRQEKIENWVKDFMRSGRDMRRSVTIDHEKGVITDELTGQTIHFVDEVSPTPLSGEEFRRILDINRFPTNVPNVPKKGGDV